MAANGLQRLIEQRAGELKTFESLRNDNFRLLWTGNLATQAGSFINTVTVGWLVYEKTQSAGWLGISGFVSGIPMLLFSLVGGVMADRLNRHRVMLFNQMVGMLVSLAFVALLAFDIVEIWHILALSFILGITSSINVPVRQAMVPTLVGRENVVNALALHSVGLNTMRIVGPSLAGVLIATIGPVGCFVVQAAGFIWAFINVLQMKVPPQAPVDRKVSPLRTLTDGLAYVAGDKVLFWILAVVALPTFFVFPYQQMLPLFAEKVLAVGPTGLGMLTSAVGIGALTSALAVASFGNMRGKGRLLMFGLILYPLFIGLFALSPWFAGSLVALLFAGMSWSIASAIAQSLLQTLSKPQYAGRVMSVFAVTWGLQPIGNLAVGGVADAVGAPTALAAGCVIALVLTLALFARQARLRQLV
ncbi:MAG: MFS transporter [Chloroflexi bacterium]|nr:MFS transporter [Chloroflexota bacterium]